ncbi:MAG: trigger factor, partial [Dehalococcoidia bacterium]|nr:trigger factor [Dehalococcoidia bacterium]
SSVRVEPKTVEVTDEMIEEQVDAIRRRFATQVPVDREARWDDVLIADVTGTVDGEDFVHDEAAEFVLKEGQQMLLDGLAEAFLGMKGGEEKSVELAIPDDFQVQKFQGKTAAFTLSVTDVKEEQLPDADDELAAQVNEEEFDSFQKLRDRIEADLLENEQRIEDGRIQQEALDQMVELATLEYPRIFVDREIDGMVEESVGNDRDGYLNYLQRMGQSEDQFRADFEEAAIRRVRRSLVMSQLADSEGIKVEMADVDARLDELVAPAGDEAGRLRELFATPDGISAIERNLLTEKTLARIREIATSSAPAVKAGANKDEPGSDEDQAAAEEEKE